MNRLGLLLIIKAFTYYYYVDAESEPEPVGVAVTCPPPCIYAASVKSVYRIPIKESDGITPNGEPDVLYGDNNGYIRSVEIDPINGHLFWGDFYHNTINRTSLDGSNPITLFKYAIGYPRSLTVDWSSNILYWADTLTNEIEVSTSDGLYRKLLLKFIDNEEPRGLLAEPLNGYLFWTIEGSTSRIERSSLSGENKTIIASTNIKSPKSLAFDYTSNRLSWIDSYLDVIESVNPDGTERRIEHKLNFLKYVHTYDMAYNHQKKIYYVSEWYTSSIYAVFKNSDNKTEAKLIHQDSKYKRATVGHIVIHEENFINVSKPCSPSNNRCSQLCLKTSKTDSVCACGTGYYLSSDNVTCLEAKREIEIYFADSSSRSIKHISKYLDQDGFVIKNLPVHENATYQYPEALTYDSFTEMVYWIDRKTRKTLGMKEDGTNYRVINTENKYHASRGIAISSISQNYYTFENDALVMGRLPPLHNTLSNTSVMERIPDLSYKKTISEGKMNEPRDIVVYKDKYLFYSDFGNSRIVRVELKTQKRYSFTVTRKVQVPYFAGLITRIKYLRTKATGLAIDQIEKRLYYCDDQSFTIESVNFDFTGHKVIFHQTSFKNGYFKMTPEEAEVVAPFSIGILNEKMYWTDLYHQAIFAANKRTGSHVEYITGGLRDPKDLHVFSKTPYTGKRMIYKFSFDKKDSKFGKCYPKSFNCSSIELPDPDLCPHGYRETKMSSNCENCTDTIGANFVCGCDNWMGCAQRSASTIQACQPQNPVMFFKVRECEQIEKPGFCPYDQIQCDNASTLNCTSDNDCDGETKCCESSCDRKQCIVPLLQTDHPCSINNGNCSHFCMAADLYYCTCPDGMQINESDPYSCEKIPPPTCFPPCLYTSNISMIFRIPLNSTTGLPLANKGHPQKVLEHHGMIKSIEIDPINNHIYWGDFQNGLINRSSLNGNNLTTLFEFGIGYPESLAFDWSTNILYWVDSKTKTIELSTSDGKYRKVLFQFEYNDTPKSIAVDPATRFLFWSVWGNNPRIERSDLDGSNRITLIDNKITDHKITEPIDLMIDYKEPRLIWIDKNIIYSRKINDNIIVQDRVINNNNFNANTMTYDMETEIAYFWSPHEKSHDAIYAVDNKENVTKIYEDISYYTKGMNIGQLKLHHTFADAVFKQVTKNCLRESNQCSHLCLKSKIDTIICACPSGMVIETLNPYNCVPIKSQYDIIVGETDNGNLTILKFYESGFTQHAVHIPLDEYHVTYFDLDSVNDLIYWYDSHRRTLYRMKINGTELQIILTGIYVSEVAVDSLSQLLIIYSNEQLYLYTTDGQRKTLSVRIPIPYYDQPMGRMMPPNPDSEKRLHYIMPLPNMLVHNGYIYYLFMGRLKKINLFTYKEEEIYQTAKSRIQIDEMAIDKVTNRIYWLNSYNMTLESIDLDFTNHGIRKIDKFKYPVSMDIYNERIFWVEAYSDLIKSIDIKGSESVKYITRGLLPAHRNTLKIIKPKTAQENETVYYTSTSTKNKCYKDTCAENMRLDFPDPQPCSIGYMETRLEMACSNCTEKFNNRYVCPCNDWKTCAQRVDDLLNGCPLATPNLYFKIRECKRVINPGYCPHQDRISTCIETKECVTDSNCTANEKCCHSGCGGKKCMAALQKPNNPCVMNKCSHFCIAAENSHKCECPDRMELDPNDKKTCRNSTKEENSVCELPSKTGACKAYLPRYYYDIWENKCKKFVYGGCQSNGNNFAKLADCEDRCGGTSDICSLKSDHGPCQSLVSIVRWYFNDQMKKCETFSYGGCHGNKNNFETEKECMGICSGYCPSRVEPYSFGTCVIHEEKSCMNNTSCKGRQLCCNNPCGGTECQMPVTLQPIASSSQPPVIPSPCEGNPCQNNGVCKTMGSFFVCDCVGNFAGNDCATSGVNEAVSIAVQVSNDGNGVTEDNLRDETAEQLTQFCQNAPCQLATAPDAVKRRRKRRLSFAPFELTREDIHVLSYENKNEIIKMQFYATTMNNELLTSDAVTDGFNSFGDSFGEKYGLKFLGFATPITTTQKPVAKGKVDSNHTAKGISIFVGIALCVLALVAIAVTVYRFKKKKKQPGVSMQWTNSNQMYNNLDTQAGDLTPRENTTEGFVNPVFASNQEEGAVNNNIQSEAPTSGDVAPLEKKMRVDIGEYAQPQDDKIPITDFVEANLSDPLPPVTQKGFLPDSVYNDIAGMLPPEYSSRPNTPAMGTKFELPAYTSRINVRENDSAENNMLPEKVIIDDVISKNKAQPSYSFDNFKMDKNNFSTTSLRDTNSFDNGLFSYKDSNVNARTLSTTSLQDSGSFNTPFLPSDDENIRPLSSLTNAPVSAQDNSTIRTVSIEEGNENENDSMKEPTVIVVKGNSHC